MSYTLNYYSTLSGIHAHAIPISLLHDGTYLISSWRSTNQILAYPSLLLAHTYNGLSFIQIARLDLFYSYGAVAYDGTYYYLASGTNLYVYSLNANNETFDLLDSIVTSGTIRSIYCDSAGYIHCSEGLGIRAYFFDGINISYTGGNYNLGYASLKITGAGTAILCSYGTNAINSQCLKSFTFNGTSYTNTATYSTDSNITSLGTALYTDGEYWFIANSQYMTALSFDGSSFTQTSSNLDIGASSFPVYGITGDGNNIYLSRNTYGIRAVSFDGLNWAEIGSILDTGGTPPGYYQQVDYYNYCFYIGGSGSGNYNSIKAVNTDVSAQFTLDMATGKSPLTIQFTSL